MSEEYEPQFKEPFSFSIFSRVFATSMAVCDHCEIWYTSLVHIYILENSYS